MLQGRGGKTTARVWEGYGKKNLSFFFCINREKSKIFIYLLHFHSEILQFSTFFKQGGGRFGKYSFFLIGGTKIIGAQGGGLCFLGSAYGNPPPFLLPLPTYGPTPRKRECHISTATGEGNTRRAHVRAQ